MRRRKKNYNSNTKEIERIYTFIGTSVAMDIFGREIVIIKVYGLTEDGLMTDMEILPEEIEIIKQHQEIVILDVEKIYGHITNSVKEAAPEERELGTKLQQYRAINRKDKEFGGMENNQIIYSRIYLGQIQFIETEEENSTRDQEEYWEDVVQTIKS
ncbi:hypothetical protein FQA39_LY06149 [Lamprigera yunnana]|nr:hypothetical protein FQA39_LY06149 [Lamprigera yunnana]